MKTAYTDSDDHFYVTVNGSIMTAEDRRRFSLATAESLAASARNTWRLAIVNVVPCAEIDQWSPYSSMG